MAASDYASRIALLTPRQREVLWCLGEGKSNWETGVILGCRETTVKKHVTQILRVLQVENRHAAARIVWEANELRRANCEFRSISRMRTTTVTNYERRMTDWEPLRKAQFEIRTSRE